MKTRLLTNSMILFCLTTSSLIYAQSVQLTIHDNISANFDDILHAAIERSGLGNLTPEMFTLGERTELANDIYYRYDQVRDGIKIKGKSLRYFISKDQQRLIFAQGYFADPQQLPSTNFAQLIDTPMVDLETTAKTKALSLITHHRENRIHSTAVESSWQNGRIVITVTIKVHHGRHVMEFILDEDNTRLVTHQYKPYLHFDPLPTAANAGMTVRANLYPVYEEEYGSPILERKEVELRYLNTKVHDLKADPFISLRSGHYTDAMQDEEKGQTQAGREQGYWSKAYLTTQANALIQQSPLRDNGFPDDFRLSGRYISVNIHPLAIKSPSVLPFSQRFSDILMYHWVYDETSKGWDFIPDTALWGKPFKSQQEILLAPAIRDPQHDYQTYLRQGFDELQVYYAATTLYETLHKLGVVDPKIAERPMTAYLYDPDPVQRDNAFYADDTINFATYSPDEPNLARDNTMIWHEMGHGFMERLMGSNLTLINTRGLAEGLADTIAEFTLRGNGYNTNFPKWEARRIINHTGFYLTNEIHDDGEAFGGTMVDLLNGATTAYGATTGLAKIADLTFEAMRFGRDHPALDEKVWLDLLLYADEIGHPPLRTAGEFRNLIETSFRGRNFNLNATQRMSMDVTYNGQKVENAAPGSRDNPLELTFPAGSNTASYPVGIEFDRGATAADQSYTIVADEKSGYLHGGIWVDGGEPAPSFPITAQKQHLNFTLKVASRCAYPNSSDGGCNDYVQFMILDHGDAGRVLGKKRFYVKISPKTLSAMTH